jgi:putative resolvase
LSDPDARVIAVERRDRLAWFAVGHLQAALSAHDRRIVIADAGETADDRARKVIEVQTGMCARCVAAVVPAIGRRALTAAKRNPGEAA